MVVDALLGKKFIDPNPALADNQSSAQVIPWPFIRYTEVALNYVEACIETGDEAEAKTWLKQDQVPCRDAGYNRCRYSFKRSLPQ
jgi:hypothetical protein